MPRRKCRIICVVGITGSDLVSKHKYDAGCSSAEMPRKLHFWPARRRRVSRDERRREDRRRQLCHASMGSGLGPDYPEKRILWWPCTRLTKVEKQRENKMIRYFDVVQHQSHEVGNEVEKQRDITEVAYCRLYVFANSDAFDPLSYSTHMYISNNKRKRKRSLHLYTSALLSFSVS